MVFLASLLCLLWAPQAAPAKAAEITAAGLLAEAAANLHLDQSGGHVVPFMDLMSRITQHGDPEILAMEMIRDENRNTLELYTVSRETVIPLVSAQLYIIHAVRVSQVKRGKVEELAPEERPPPPPWFVRQGPSELPAITDMNKFAKLLERHPVPALKGIRPVDWLFEQDGLFSGRPWDWENFLPRLATVGALVLGGLLVVEGLHALLALGRRAMGGGRRQDRRA